MTALLLIAAGQGVALISDLDLPRPPPGVRVLNLARPLSRSVQPAHRSASSQRPAIAAICATLLEIAGELQYIAA